MSSASSEKSDIVFWQGNEVVARAAIAAGCRFYGGYPITPSSEIAAVMAELLPEVGGTFIQMEDEIAAMGTVIGASLVGKKSLTATSGPGFSLKLEHLGYACIAEVPCVIVNVMRGGPSTGLPTAPAQADVMQAKWGTHGDHPTIALAPAFHREIYLDTIKAFNISEKYRVPVIILIDEVLGHMSEGMIIPDPSEYEIIDRVKPSVPPEEYNPYDTQYGDVPPMANYFEGYRFHVTGLNHGANGFPTTVPDICHNDEVRMIQKVMKDVDTLTEYDEYMLEDAEVAVFAFGSTARGAKMAVEKARQEGLKVGLFRAITLWPFPEKVIHELGQRVKAFVVPEMNLGQMILEVERSVHKEMPIVGVNKVGGVPVPPYEILEKIKEVLQHA
ncbi:2-oxoglutarate synthase subunit alpha [candidate division LCP-89 bacterium B3_LCP]|uniref:2-oxoglutarate synthase subunit alpha n=1 Tax=candidate division LCP-89 bacterium B3_LCP TaxID=2012998 RepID=A0A532V5M4_UNCL8|nr:MAG: 2-oxoglutarate synthase subunit alpha [candidate division LCP-89 bacterium B3_LCP]